MLHYLNFVFYDLDQLKIGSCQIEQIAIRLVCPVISIYKKRNSLLLYGGSVHFSKDYIVENNNNNYSLKRVLADFYRYNKKFDLALKIYDEMIKENQDDLWNIYYMRGICYERKDNWELAEKDFLKSLELQPGTPNVLNYLAYGWVERDIKLDRSLKMLEEAYKANPDSFYIIDSLAWAHFKKNNLSEAARLMEKVIDIAPGEAISLDHLGDIYYAMNRKREAIHFWQQALELAEPEDEITEDVQSKLDNINAG